MVFSVLWHREPRTRTLGPYPNYLDASTRFSELGAGFRVRSKFQATEVQRALPADPTACRFKASILSIPKPSKIP